MNSRKVIEGREIRSIELLCPPPTDRPAHLRSGLRPALRRAAGTSQVVHFSIVLDSRVKDFRDPSGFKVDFGGSFYIKLQDLH